MGTWVGGWPPCSLGFRKDVCVSRMFGAERITEQRLESTGWRLGNADRSVWLKWGGKVEGARRRSQRKSGRQSLAIGLVSLSRNFF